MKIFAKTEGLSRSEWLELRAKGIGGSDVSVIAGINTFKSVFQLWMEKTGLMEIEEEENEFLHFGNVLEPVVRNEFMNRTGKKVKLKKAIIQHPEYPFMMANVDGLIYDKEDGLCIFEAKTASAYKEKEWDNHVPEEYQLQVQHYMAVTGAKKTYIAALIGGNKFVYHTIERDEELIKLIIEMESHFWNYNVLKNIPPDIDGSPATTQYFNSKYSQGNGERIQLPKEAKELILSYDQIVESLKELDKKKGEITNKLKSYLEENELGVIEDRVIKWSTITKEQLDQKKLKQERKDIYQNYANTCTYRRFTVA